MKKVLILAYDFPPYISVGGLRPYNFYKFFLAYNVEPIVITRQWKNQFGNSLDYISSSESSSVVVEKTEFGTLIKTPYKANLANRIMLKHGESKYRLLRKVISAHYEFGQFILPIGPKKELYKAAKDYLKSNKVDAIIATGDPFVLFKYASKLSKEFNTPWIADYRDPWSHNEHIVRNKFLQLWHAYLEKKYVSNAYHISTVSNFVKKKIESLISNKEFSILPNGFDPDAMDSIQSISQGKEKLQLAFVGTIYKWHPIDSFLRVVSSFIDSNPKAKIQLNFFGVNLDQELIQLVEEKYPNLLPHFFLSPRIPNEVLMAKLSENNVMILFNYYSYMGTKIFDYLGIRRKIIMCYSNDQEAQLLKEKYYTIEEFDSESKHLQEDLINETKSGIIVKDANHLLHVLEDLYEEFQTTGQIACNSIGIENYSRKIQVAKLAELIKEIKPL